MTDLSPAAQAVYDAWYEAIDAYSEQDPPPQLAASLRAVAEQVYNKRRYGKVLVKDILTIADELEGNVKSESN